MSTAEPRDEALVTLAQYAGLPEEERYRVEAVRGRLVREPRPAPLHSRVQTRLLSLLDGYERAQRTGGVVLVEVEFVLRVAPLTVRIPDVAWVSAARIPARGLTLPRWHFSPDLAAEVVSPRNTATEVAARVSDYLSAGSRLVWVVDPRPRTVLVHRPRATPVHLDVTAELGAGDVIPGFRVPVRDLFPD